MNCQEAKPLLPEYWDNALRPAERATLEAHLETCPDCRGEASELGRVWTMLTDLPPEAPGVAMRQRFYDRFDAYRQGFGERRKSWFSGWRLPAPAFSMAMLIAGVCAGHFWPVRDDGRLTQLRTEVNSMRQLVALSLLQQQNATDRLQGVNWTYRVERSDTEVLSALLQTVNHDPNVNVRLAAVDALRSFADSPVVRRSLSQALLKQESPLVQIAIIDQLVALKDTQGRPALDQLAQDRKVNAAVRQHAEWALKQIP